MLSARTAVLLGGLGIKIGVQHMYGAADQEMMIWRGRPEVHHSSRLSISPPRSSINPQPP